jgi:hypothetical protein
MAIPAEVVSRHDRNRRNGESNLLNGRSSQQFSIYLHGYAVPFPMVDGTYKCSYSA